MFFWPEISPTRCSSESSDNPFTFVKVELLAAVVHLAMHNDALLARNLPSFVPRDAGARAEIIHSDTRWYARYTLRLNFPTLDCAQAPIYSATSSSQSKYGFRGSRLLIWIMITVVNTIVFQNNVDPNDALLQLSLDLPILCIQRRMLAKVELSFWASCVNDTHRCSSGQ